ncbi:MAG: SAM-dependent methyltransferase [Solobacterium sp.]|nr:SAM-dependent methyltransferase [Solobacterium sp.]
MNRRIDLLETMIHPGSILADIGTDHGYLPVRAVQHNRVEKAYACDVAAGPLSQARHAVSSLGLGDRITCILSDGFEQVPLDATCAVLAGMGFHTAKRILEAAEGRLDRLDQIIVQSNNDLPLLRKWISEHHYAIVTEAHVYDRGKYYTAIEFTTSYHSPYNETDLLCGPMDAIKDIDAWMEYADHELERLSFVNEKRGGDKDAMNQIWLIEGRRQELLERKQTEC